MKKERTTAGPTLKPTAAKQAIGGQPENDRDAREAGLSSATSAGGEVKNERGERRPARTPAKPDKGS